MVTAIVKLILSLLVGAVGYQQYMHQKSIAALFCFAVSVLLFVGFLLDLIRMAIACHKKAENMERPAVHRPAPPAASDYQDSPDMSDLKIGHTYRPVDVNKFADNLLKLAQETPEYKFSESELIDNYLTDKKIWKYSFRPQQVTVEAGPGPFETASLRVLVNGSQIGTIRALDSVKIKKAMKNTGIEVVYCTMGGGPYKIVHEDVYSGKYTLQSGETGYSVTLSICEK